MKYILGLLLVGALTLAGAAGAARAGEPVGRYTCEGKVADHRRAPNCPVFPDTLPTLTAEVTMEYPQCAVRTNASEILASVKHEFDDAEVWIAEGTYAGGSHNRFLPPNVAYIEEYDALYGRFAFKDSEGHERGGYAVWNRAGNEHPDDRGVSIWIDGEWREAGSRTSRYYGEFHKGLKVSLSKHELAERIRDCAYRIEVEREARKERKEKLDALVAKQIELESVQWELATEVKLQEDLLALTRSIIAAQKRVDAALRQLREVRMAGIEARAALWRKYAAQAAEESAEFFQQLQERHDSLAAVQRQIEEDAAKHKAFIADLDRLESEARAALQDAEGELTGAADEVRRIREELNSLQAQSGGGN